MTFSGTSDDGSNRNSNAPGKKWPSTEGPSTISGHDLADHAGLTEILEQIGKDPDEQPKSL